MDKATELIEIDSTNDRKITMSNALVRAGHGLTLAEKRIVMIAISKLDSTKKPPSRSVLTTKITASEYAEECNVSMNTAYDQLKEASEVLHKRVIVFYTPSHKRKGSDLNVTISKMNWVGQVDYQHGEGWVRLHWWPPLIKHLMGLKRQFTSYYLQQGTALRSIYSWRLVELLLRFKKTGWAEYTIEDFAQSMEATAKQRNDFAAIRRKIIEPAINELQDKHGWKINWKPIKDGRRVRAIRFEFSRKGGFIEDAEEL
jgi:plasmid replication initiation protein